MPLYAPPGGGGSHAASHANGGADEVDATGLAGTGSPPAVADSVISGEMGGTPPTGNATVEFSDFYDIDQTPLTLPGDIPTNLGLDINDLAPGTEFEATEAGVWDVLVGLIPHATGAGTVTLAGGNFVTGVGDMSVVLDGTDPAVIYLHTQMVLPTADTFQVTLTAAGGIQIVDYVTIQIVRLM